MRILIRYLLFSFLFATIIFGQKTDSLKLNLTARSLPYNIESSIPSEFENFSIVLSGGGSRGVAEVGVLKALEECNVPFTRIYGTSIGAIIGGMYAAGYSLDEIENILLKTDWNSFYSLEEKNRAQLFLEQKRILDNAFITLRLDGFDPIIPKSVNSGFLISNFFTKIKFQAPLNRITDFNKFRYEFRAVATNLYTGKSVLLKHCDLGRAFRASSSVTFLMPPVQMDSVTLVDGGVVANIPVRPAKNDGADFVIAIDITSPLRKKNELRYPWEIADQLVSLPMQEINERNRRNADFIFAPHVDKKSDDFTGLDTLVQIGYEQKRKVPELKEKIISFLIKKNPSLGERITDFNFVTNSDIAEYFAKQFEGKSSVSKAELYYELYLSKKKFSLKDVYLKIAETDSLKSISVVYDFYPEIKSVRFDFISDDNEIGASFVDSLFAGAYASPENIFRIINSKLLEIRKEGDYSTRFLSYRFDKSNGVLLVSFVQPSVSEIEIKGNAKTKSYVIERELVFQRNKKLTRESLTKSLDNLRISDLFSDVRISLKKISLTEDVLEVDVSEKPTKLIRFGLKIDNQYLTRIFFDIRNENVRGTGNQIGLSFFGGIRSQDITLEHIAPRIFSSFFTYKLQLNYNHILIPKFKKEKDNFLRTEEDFQYDQSEASMLFGLGRQLPRLGNVFVLWKYSRAKIWNFPKHAEDETISALKLKFTIDSRSDIYFAENGMFFDAFYEKAFDILGSKQSFSKTFFQYLLFIKLAEPLVIYPQISLGYADKKLPLSQQFSIGGQFNFFGMHLFQERGGQVFKTSLGLRYKFPMKILFPVYFGIRYDLGRIWEKRENIKLNDLAHGIGVSLAFKTPIGPAVFSVGRSFYFKNKIPDEIVIFGDYHFYFTLGYYLSFY